MTKKEAIKTYFKDLLYSFFRTTNLFKFAIYTWITPLLSFIIVCALISVPSIVGYNTLTAKDITSQVLYLDEVMAHVLDTDIKCHVDSKKLVCDEGYSYEELYEFKNANNDTIRYKIIINKDISGMNFSTTDQKFGEHFDNENYLVFFETTFSFRYRYHNPRTESVSGGTTYAFYDKLNNLDFHELYEQANASENKSEFLLNKSNEIILNGYKAVTYEQIFTGLVSNISLYLIFILVIGLLLKGNLMLKRKKGFKYSQTIKIGLVASLQPAIIALVLSLFGFNFMTLFGLILVVRILIIYFRYTGSRRNVSWLDDLYKLTNDERFKIE